MPYENECQRCTDGDGHERQRAGEPMGIVHHLSCQWLNRPPAEDAAEDERDSGTDRNQDLSRSWHDPSLSPGARAVTHGEWDCPLGSSQMSHYS